MTSENAVHFDLDQVVDKLAQRLPSVPRELLRSEAETAHEHFAAARVVNYVQVLVERAVRKQHAS